MRNAALNRGLSRSGGAKLETLVATRKSLEDQVRRLLSAEVDKVERDRVRRTVKSITRRECAPRSHKFAIGSIVNHKRWREIALAACRYVREKERLWLRGGREFVLRAKRLHRCMIQHWRGNNETDRSKERAKEVSVCCV